jgi:hypothetical protein
MPGSSRLTQENAMKRVMSAIAAIAAVAVLTAAALAQPQPQQPQPEQSLHFSSAEGSEVRVDGDSSLHKWTVRGRQIDGTIDFHADVPSNAAAQQIVDAIVANPKVSAKASVPVTTLKSTKNDKGMDNKMYGALNQKNHPTLYYELTEVTAVRRESPTRFAIDTKGNLKVAGTTRVLSTPMNVELTSDRAIVVTAKFGTLMTDFGVKPPEALGGMVKADNKVVVTVRWSVSR